MKVGKLSGTLNEGHLKEIFGSFGKIVSLQMPGSDIAYRPSKRFAVIEFADKQALAAAVDLMHNGEINGQVVSVVELNDSLRERSREKEKARKEEEPGKKAAAGTTQTDKKTGKPEAEDKKGKQNQAKEKAGKEAKPKQSGRFRRNTRHNRSSSNSSDSASSKKESSNSSRSSSSSLSESSNSSSD